MTAPDNSKESSLTPTAPITEDSWDRDACGSCVPDDLPERSNTGGEEPIQLFLCEIPQLTLRENQLYIFQAAPGCIECEAYKNPASTPIAPERNTGMEKDRLAAETRESVEANTRGGQKMARAHILPSAAYWFKGSRNAQDGGHGAEAVLCMENAYNHVENALAAAIVLLRECHGRMGNTAFPSLAAGIATFLGKFDLSSHAPESSSAAGVSGVAESLAPPIVGEGEKEKDLWERGDAR